MNNLHMIDMTIDKLHLKSTPETKQQKAKNHIDALNIGRNPAM